MTVEKNGFATLGFSAGAAVFYCPEKDYSLALISNISIFDQINVINDLVEIISVQN